MNEFSTLLEHIEWADARVVEAIGAVDVARPERDQATRLYAHLAAAEHVWQRRIDGEDALPVVWPDLTLDNARMLAEQTRAALRRIVADEQALGRVIRYRTSTGSAYSNTVADILTHVALHGAYHRGQIALLCRQAGADPAVTDFIAFRREPALKRVK